MSVFDIINYDNCITNLTSSIQKHFGIKVNYKTNPIIDNLLSEKDYQNIIVFVFDGMGESIINKNTTENHFLQTHRVSSMHSTFPPTTANATTAFMSGLNPISTGWLGWSTYYKDLNISVDNFPNVNSITREVIKDIHIADTKLAYKPMGEIIEENNKAVKYYTVFPSFKEGGCKSLKEFEHRIVKLCSLPGKKYIYAYWDEPDKSMHDEGTCTYHIKKILNDISKCLKSIQIKTKNTIGIVSADHSQVDVVPIMLYTYYDVLDCMYAPMSCDTRCAFFFIKDDHKKQFESLFAKYFAEYFELYTKEEVLNNNLFGSGEKHHLIDEIVGDYIAIAKDKYFFMVSPNAHLFKGAHAGGLLEEMMVPIIIIKN